MAETTELDTAHAAMAAAPDDDAARLAFFGALADAQVWLLLEGDPEGDAIVPQLAETEDGRFALAFDTEERLAAFAEGVAPHAALPGRALARMLAGEGIGLGLNLGVALSEILLPPTAMSWLVEVLDTAPEAVADDRPVEVFAPEGIPEPLLRALDARLARAAGLATCAWLAGVAYSSGRRGNVLAIIGASPEAEHALSDAVADALRFGEQDIATLDVTFLAQGDALAARLERVGLRFDLPEPPAAEIPERPAPGSDPDKPPKLR